MLGVAGEFLPQPRILRGHADRASVQMADAHHHAAQRHQRRRCEAKFLGAEQRPNHDVAAGLELAIDLDHDTAPQIVEEQRLLGLGQTQLPRAPACLILVSGDAPVPPSWPLMSTTSAWALATPAATVPTPTSATSFTLIRRLLIAVLQSWINSARSSME